MGTQLRRGGVNSHNLTRCIGGGCRVQHKAQQPWTISSGLLGMSRILLLMR